MRQGLPPVDRFANLLPLHAFGPGGTIGFRETTGDVLRSRSGLRVLPVLFERVPGYPQCSGHRLLFESHRFQSLNFSKHALPFPFSGQWRFSFCQRVNSTPLQENPFEAA